jgi:hypothetical protein
MTDYKTGKRGEGAGFSRRRRNRPGGATGLRVAAVISLPVEIPSHLSLSSVAPSDLGTRLGR